MYVRMTVVCQCQYIMSYSKRFLKLFTNWSFDRSFYNLTYVIYIHGAVVLILFSSEPSGVIRLSSSSVCVNTSRARNDLFVFFWPTCRQTDRFNQSTNKIQFYTPHTRRLFCQIRHQTDRSIIWQTSSTTHVKIIGLSIFCQSVAAHWRLPSRYEWIFIITHQKVLFLIK